jgi:hypothetical protein
MAYMHLQALESALERNRYISFSYDDSELLRPS